MITIIAALDRRRAIGYRNQLLFHLSADLRRFKALTTGHTVIMGRRTFESLPKGALPDRRNIVLTRTPNMTWPNTETFASLSEALDACAQQDDIFIIGGASVYAEALPLADRLCLTHVDAEAPQADVYFPEFSREEWSITHEEKHEADEKNAQPYTFTDYVRKPRH